MIISFGTLITSSRFSSKVRIHFDIRSLSSILERAAFMSNQFEMQRRRQNMTTVEEKEEEENVKKTIRNCKNMQNRSIRMNVWNIIEQILNEVNGIEMIVVCRSFNRFDSKIIHPLYKFDHST